MSGCGRRIKAEPIYIPQSPHNVLPMVIGTVFDAKNRTNPHREIVMHQLLYTLRVERNSKVVAVVLYNG
jgi:hypothetical protein